MDASKIIGESGCEGFLFYGLAILSFSESLKINCRENVLKIGVTGVGEIKMRVGKEGTDSKSFPENIAKVLRVLNTPSKEATKISQLLAKHYRHRC